MPTALVTSGPTYEPIDPVRFIGNRSSGKQGHAIALALQKAGFEVTLVTGPVYLPDPGGVQVIHVITAAEMLAVCQQTLPVDVAVCAAAVGDWRVMQPAKEKIKKDDSGKWILELEENPDILHTIATHPNKRPKLVIGFAAETEKLVEYATAKLERKKCDWILANQVSENLGFGQEENKITHISDTGVEEWPMQSKQAVATMLVDKIQQYFTSN